MAFFYSISSGIMWGIIFYVLINLFCGKHKKISLLMYLLALIFIAKMIFLG